MAATLAGLLLAVGCTATFDNDDFDWGDSQNKDRWYTGGARFEHPVVGGDDGSLLAGLDTLLLGVAQSLPSAGDGRPGSVSTATGVLGIQVYTPEDTSTSANLPDDRPYAGWAYAGVVRTDTWLDPDPLRRRDQLSTVELDVGMVGPVTHVQELQEFTHDLFNGNDAQGWDNQLNNEPGVVLRSSRWLRLGYAELAPRAGFACDFSPRVDGALGNIDTHVGVGGMARLGFNLSRGFSPYVGDPADRPLSSLYLFTGVDGRFVIHNLFLDGNTFTSSDSVNEERFVGETAFGIGWERGPWRIAYSRRLRTEEFERQPDEQVYGSIVLSWTPRGD